MGAFNYSYPIPVPPSGFGAAPSVGFSYSSGAVDGVVSDENTQGGYLGLGWNLDASGFIERSYKPCPADAGGWIVNDMCWVSDNATISLNGHSGELILEGSAGGSSTWWRLKNDPGWRIRRDMATPGSFDNRGEKWTVFTPDGTQYVFGQRFEPTTGQDLASVWWMPVFGNQVGEPCYNATASLAWCQQAWRWNLDYVKDRFGNTQTFRYTAELNKYARFGTPANATDYVRGGVLSEIRYGARAGAEGAYRDRVVFNYRLRCGSDPIGNCEWLMAGHPTPWYLDSPTDKTCTASPCTANQYAPAFWTQWALDSIDTQVRRASQDLGQNLKSNGSFESGMSGWGVWSPPGTTTNFAIYGAPNQDGAQHLEMNSAPGVGVVYGTIAMTPVVGADYTVIGWVRAPSGSIAGSIQLTAPDGTWEGATAAFTANSTWQQVSAVLTPANGTHTYLQVQLASNVAGASVDFDNVTVLGPWRTVDTIKPLMDWADPDGGGPQGGQQWLREIQHTGAPGSPLATSVPAVRFDSTVGALDNRADAITMLVWRVNQIDDEIGGRTTVVYGQKTACTSLGGPWVNNIQDCYPRWTVVGSSAGWGTFNKFLVSSVTRSDLVAGGTSIQTAYTYVGDPMYHHDDSPFTTNKTWSDPRGYAQVLETTGSGTVTQTRHYFARGMNGDDNGAGGTKSVSNTYFDGSTQADDWQLQGREFQTEVIDSVSGNVIERDSSVYSYIPVVSGGTARLVTDTSHRHQSRDNGGNYFYTRTDTTYDNFGFPTEAWDRDDTSGGITYSGSGVCTLTAYQRDPSLPDRWLVDHAWQVRQVVHTPSGCNGAELSKSETKFDTQNYGDTLTTGVGFPTGTRTWVDYPGAPVSSQTDEWLETLITPTADGSGKVWKTDPPGSVGVTEITYDTFGLASTSKDPSGHSVTSTTDPGRGSATVVTDDNKTTANGDGPDKVTLFTFDGLGRTTSVQLPGDPDPTVRFEYVVSKTSPNPSRIRQRVQQSAGVWIDSYSYIDGLGRTRETQTASPAGTGGRMITATEFDNRGLAVKSISNWNISGTAGSGMATNGPFASSSMPAETRSTYDSLGRPTLVAQYSFNAQISISGTPVQTSTVYDGHWTNSYPPGGSPTSTHTNGLGQTDVTVAYNTSWVGGKSTNYTYDKLGRLLTTTDPKGNVTTVDYDSTGRQLRYQDRDAGTSYTTYNAAGQVATTKDGAGQILGYTYDSMGRPTSITDGAGGTILEQYAYDKNSEAGLLDYALSKTGGADIKIDTIGYDTRGRPTGYDYVIPSIPGWTDTNGLAGTYSFTGITYDRADHQTSITYPAVGSLAAETVTTGYDNYGNATTLNGASTYVGSSTFTAEGRLAARVLGAGTYAINRTYSYWIPMGWLTTMKATQAGVDIQHEWMTYDARNNLIVNSHGRTTGSTNTECFGYSGRSELIVAYTNGSGPTAPACGSAGTGYAPYNVTYAIDEIGNLTAGPAGAYAYPASGPSSTRPHAPTSTTTSSSISWNADGTMYRRTTSGVVTEYGWDQFNHLTSVSSPVGTPIQSMLYYAGGERVLAKDLAGVHLYLGPLGERHALISGSVTEKRHYSIGSTNVAARSKSGGAADTVDFLLGDVRGSTSMSISSGTTSTTEQWYSPYGAVRAGALGAVTSHAYIGQNFDAASGLLYLHSRYYSPDLGELLSVDRKVASTRAPYLYTGGNPASFHDPSGLDRCDNPQSSGKCMSSTSSGYAQFPGIQSPTVSSIRTVSELRKALGIGIDEQGSPTAKPGLSRALDIFRKWRDANAQAPGSDSATVGFEPVTAINRAGLTINWGTLGGECEQDRTCAFMTTTLLSYASGEVQVSGGQNGGYGLVDGLKDVGWWAAEAFICIGSEGFGCGLAVAGGEIASSAVVESGGVRTVSYLVNAVNVKYDKNGGVVSTNVFQTSIWVVESLAIQKESHEATIRGDLEGASVVLPQGGDGVIVLNPNVVFSP